MSKETRKRHLLPPSKLTGVEVVNTAPKLTYTKLLGVSPMTQRLFGNTHSETARIQRVVDSTPGGPRQQYNAGKAEQKRIEIERAK